MKDKLTAKLNPGAIWLIIALVVFKIISLWGLAFASFIYYLLFIGTVIGVILRFFLHLSKENVKGCVVCVIVALFVAITPFIRVMGIRYKVMPKQYEAAAELVLTETERQKDFILKTNTIAKQERLQHRLGVIWYDFPSDKINYISFHVNHGLLTDGYYIKVYQTYNPTTDSYYNKVTDLGDGWYYAIHRIPLDGEE